jgi:hypothetical protein
LALKPVKTENELNNTERAKMEDSLETASSGYPNYVFTQNKIRQQLQVWVEDEVMD